MAEEKGIRRRRGNDQGVLMLTSWLVQRTSIGQDVRLKSLASLFPELVDTLCD
jgi:hypothetical protein|tara:strand:+ start:5739 stop:5897 length:159 start_codon:yes stop_codon:yes gene_type:complete